MTRRVVATPAKMRFMAERGYEEEYVKRREKREVVVDDPVDDVASSNRLMECQDLTLTLEIVILMNTSSYARDCN